MPSKKKYVKNIWEVIVATFKGFRQDKVLKLSASLAYYTVFALPALALVLISVTGIFFGEDAMSGIIYKELHELIGKNAATQIQEAIKNTHLAGTSYSENNNGFLGSSITFADSTAKWLTGVVDNNSDPSSAKNWIRQEDCIGPHPMIAIG